MKFLLYSKHMEAVAHSLGPLASYLFSIGLYCSAVSVSQDSSLRKIVRKSATDLLDHIGYCSNGKGYRKKCNEDS